MELNTTDINHLKSGLEKHVSGLIDEAIKDYRQISITDPDYAFALNLQGVAAIQKEEYGHAIQLISHAITLKKTEPEFHSNLGEALRLTGRLDEAEDCQRRALSIDSRYSSAFNFLGMVLEAKGRLDESRHAFQTAIDCMPTFIKAWKNLARICQTMGDLDEAELCIRHIHTLDPEEASISCYMGNMMKKQGRWEEAKTFFCRAIQIKPDYVTAHNNLGALYHDLGHFSDAADCYIKVLNINPDNIEALNNLGSVRKEQGRMIEAADCFRRSLALQDDDGIRIKLAILVPIIPESSARISSIRGRIKTELARLLNRQLTIPDPLAQVETTTFYFAYHGQCNRELHSTLALIYEQASPDLLYVSPHCNQAPRKKIKVGFISSFMKNHSIGKTTSGLLAMISREEFEVHAIFAPRFADDECSRFIIEHADQSTFLQGSLQEARQQISGLELDILFYQDMGMDPYTYYLAFARLAPVQCVSFGHPDTTGIRTMDYFISSDLFEPEGAQEHYSEKLFLLHGLGTLAYYYRPMAPQQKKSRADFGLPLNSPVYICPQALFKVHPEFDRILIDILRSDTDGTLVLLESVTPDITNQLKKRLEQAGPDVCARIVFLPQQNNEDFISLIAISDVMLDPIHFNGMNTNMEAFSVGTPVITMPTNFQRGRHTLGMYRKMGILDCIATNPDHYVKTAVRFATDKVLREEIKNRILAASHSLYADMTVVKEFERFFREVAGRFNENRV